MTSLIRPARRRKSQIVKERVQKLMSQAGVASRRSSEELIRQGRVRVNGQPIDIGGKADPERDVITVDGEKLRFEQIVKRFYAIYKPVNVLSTNAENFRDDRSIIRDLLPVEGHLYPIGRLDAESEGLMILTNDGETANKLAHPRYEHTKTYRVVVYGRPDRQTLEAWQDGIELGEERTAPCFVEIAGTEPETTTLRVVMLEGKKRQIRRVAAALGHPVRRLIRVQIGQFEVGRLKPGEWMEMTESQVAAMQKPSQELTLIRKRKRALREARYGPRTRTAAHRNQRRDAGVAEDRPRVRRPVSGRTDSGERNGSGSTRTTDDRTGGEVRPARSRRPNSGKRPTSGGRPTGGGGSSSGKADQKRNPNTRKPGTGRRNTR